MVLVKKLVLDVLKPHIPNALEMAKAIAEQGENYQVNIDVQEVDEKTETVVIVIQADNINFTVVEETISNLYFNYDRIPRKWIK